MTSSGSGTLSPKLIVRRVSSSSFHDDSRKRLKRNGGLKERTSKKALSKAPPQKPLATMSNWAPSCVFGVAALKVSLVIGCRDGSVATP